MEYENGKKIDNAGDGDVIILDKEPYIIDDEELLELIKQKRESEKVFHYKDKRVEILEYFKGAFVSKTLVRITSV